MDKYLPKWFWKTMLFLWGLSLFILVYKAINESFELRHLALVTLYIAGILLSIKYLGLGFKSKEENKLED